MEAISSEFSPCYQRPAGRRLHLKSPLPVRRRISGCTMFGVSGANHQRTEWRPGRRTYVITTAAGLLPQFASSRPWPWRCDPRIEHIVGLDVQKILTRSPLVFMELMDDATLLLALPRRGC